MDVTVFGAAMDALQLLADPLRLLLLGTGVVVGLFLGVVPGIGGLAGMALLLPFTLTMDPFTAFAMLLGMAAVTGTSDTIPAVLFGVPGTTGAQATIIDGNAMAKNGEAGRALSAAFSASLLGGLVGALLLAITIPVLRPLMLFVGSPELLAFSIFGISTVSVLSGGAPLRGLIAAGIGILLSMIGMDTQTGTLRYTMGSLYLWEGLPIVPMVLGLFALPELADLAIRRRAIAGEAYATGGGARQGLRDAIGNWWLVVRCGAIGAAIGAVPGMGSTVVDWLAYGHAAQRVKGADKTFGSGDVRGVIAPESANNSVMAGALVPTIAFGVPGSAAMSILLSVFLIHGLTPGPEMLGANLDVTYTMVWSVAIANVLGAGLCFSFSGQFAKLAQLRYTLILPPVLTFVFIGAFQSSRSWGDIYALLLFSSIGWLMKQLQWPRPPLVLGFILGAPIERYMFISTSRYGLDWLMRPLVLILLVVSVVTILRPLLRRLRSQGGAKRIARRFERPKFAPLDLAHVAVIGLTGYALAEALGWSWAARIGPVAVGSFVLGVAVLSLANQVVVRSAGEADPDSGTNGGVMDTRSDFAGLPLKLVLRRGLTILGYLLGFACLMATIGVLPTIPVFFALFMWLEGRESWKLVLGEAAGVALFIYVVFELLLHVPWPATYLGSWIPALSVIPTV